MIAVGDRFIPRVDAGDGSGAVQLDEEIEATSVVGERVWVKRVRDGLTWDMNASTIAMQWTALGQPPAPAAPANALDQAEWASVGGVPAPRKLGDGLREIAAMLDERETKYGPAVESWERIARVAGVPTETALRVLLAMKRERAFFSPENPDHVVDEIGYLAILAEVQRHSQEVLK